MLGKGWKCGESVKMDILQIRNEIARLMKCNYPYSSEINAKRSTENFSYLINQFETKVKETDDPKLLSNIVEENKKNLLMPIDKMFLVYERLIELEPKKRNLLDFATYLWIIGGPDWKEELEAIEKLVDEDKIPESVEVALKVDYYKRSIHEG
jgi:hypothetical protein